MFPIVNKVKSEYINTSWTRLQVCYASTIRAKSCNQMDLDQVPSLWRNKPVQSNVTKQRKLVKIHLIAKKSLIHPCLLSSINSLWVIQLKSFEKHIIKPLLHLLCLTEIRSPLHCLNVVLNGRTHAGMMSWTLKHDACKINKIWKILCQHFWPRL